MARSKHTAAPWEYSYKRGFHDIIATGIDDMGHPAIIANCHELSLGRNRHGEVVANAHIMAASPQMLKALKVVYAHKDFRYADPLDQMIAMELVLSAIAKAEGRS